MRKLLSNPEGATQLDAGEIEQFERDGYLVIDDVLTTDDVDVLREATANHSVLEAQEQKGFSEKTVHLLAITTFHSAFMELATHTAVIDRVRPLIGEDIQLEHSKLATKPPTKGMGPFHWHQDFAFFPHTNTSLVAVMVMLDDATPENGCMQIVKGSHRWGLLDHMVDGQFTGACQEEDRWSDPDLIVNITPRAGGISIHHCLALHGSEPNVSGQPRRGLVFQYRADDAYQLADNVFKDTGILVSGRRRERVRCEDGVFRLPKRAQNEHPFGSAWHQDGDVAGQRDYDFDADVS
jgi:phytanoyl-CoA hydroxylase